MAGFYDKLYLPLAAAAKTLRLTLHKQIPEDEVLRSLWDNLVFQLENPQVFYTYEWSLAVARACQSSLHPLLFVAEEDDSVVGLVALATDPAGLEVSFLAGTTADYCDFLCLPKRMPEFVTVVLAELRRLGFERLSLANVPAESHTLPALAAAASRAGYFLFSRPAYLCAQVAFRSPEQRQSLKESLRRKQMVRRHMKGMAKIAPVSLRHLRSRDEINEALPAFTASHIGRFLLTGRISNLVDSERRAFLAELGSMLSAYHWVCLSTLTVGDRPVAWNFGFRFADSWFWYQPTFDTAFAQYYPGFCLLAKIIEEACDSPEINLVDLGLGNESYKDRFATGGRATVHLTATTSRVSLLKKSIRYRAAITVERFPFVEARLRMLRRIVVSARQKLIEQGVGNFLRWIWARGSRISWSRDEIVFFEQSLEVSNVPNQGAACLAVRPIDMGLLAASAVTYGADAETLGYLVRSAMRLGSKPAKGFALVDAQATPLHFCWTADFSGFHVAELDTTLESPHPRAVLIYDCWTPTAERGKGYYGIAISRVASDLSAMQLHPWIFCAATNLASLRGIEKAGFLRSFSLIRKRALFFSRLWRAQEPTSLT
jgi:CelD/BcsL family acetyltransferase involved in cellulose biosynthesis